MINLTGSPITVQDYYGDYVVIPPGKGYCYLNIDYEYSETKDNIPLYQQVNEIVYLPNKTIVETGEIYIVPENVAKFAKRNDFVYYSTFLNKLIKPAIS